MKQVCTHLKLQHPWEKDTLANFLEISSLSSHLSLNCEGCWGTTDDFTTSFLHFSLFSSPLPSGTCRTPGLSILSCCLPTSSSVCLVFFPLSLCLARRFWPDPMNGRHDHTTAVCVSLPWSGGLRVVRLPAGSWPSPSDEAKKRHLVAVSLLHVEERMAEKKVFSQQNIL